MEKFIRAAGIPVHIATQGDDKPSNQAVVLLHGYLESLDVWEEVAKHLGKHAYTVTPDLPGHGLSGTSPEVNTMEFIADVLEDLRVQMHIDKVLLVGHSMGGYAALAYAKKYPRLMAGLCLFHSTPNADPEDKLSNRDREIALIAADKRELLFSTTIPNMFALQNVGQMQNHILAIESRLNFVENQGIIACIRGMKVREDTAEVLTSLEVPLLFVFGKHDRYITWETAQKLMEKYPHAQATILENSGHCGFYEEPEKTVQTLVDFAQQTFGLPKA